MHYSLLLLLVLKLGHQSFASEEAVGRAAGGSRWVPNSPRVIPEIGESSGSSSGSNLGAVSRSAVPNSWNGAGASAGASNSMDEATQSSRHSSPLVPASPTPSRPAALLSDGHMTSHRASHQAEGNHGDFPQISGDEDEDFSRALKLSEEHWDQVELQKQIDEALARSIEDVGAHHTSHTAHPSQELSDLELHGFDDAHGEHTTEEEILAHVLEMSKRQAHQDEEKLTNEALARSIENLHSLHHSQDAAFAQDLLKPELHGSFEAPEKRASEEQMLALAEQLSKEQADRDEEKSTDEALARSIAHAESSHDAQDSALLQALWKSLLHEALEAAGTHVGAAQNLENVEKISKELPIRDPQGSMKEASPKSFDNRDESATSSGASLPRGLPNPESEKHLTAPGKHEAEEEELRAHVPKSSPIDKKPQTSFHRPHAPRDAAPSSRSHEIHEPIGRGIPGPIEGRRTSRGEARIDDVSDEEVHGPRSHALQGVTKQDESAYGQGPPGDGIEEVVRLLGDDFQAPLKERENFALTPPFSLLLFIFVFAMLVIQQLY